MAGADLHLRAVVDVTDPDVRPLPGGTRDIERPVLRIAGDPSRPPERRIRSSVTVPSTPSVALRGDDALRRSTSSISVPQEVASQRTDVWPSSGESGAIVARPNTTLTSTGTPRENRHAPNGPSMSLSWLERLNTRSVGVATIVCDPCGVQPAGGRADAGEPTPTTTASAVNTAQPVTRPPTPAAVHRSRSDGETC